MILERIPEIQKLSNSEKLTLVGELWDDLAAESENLLDHAGIIQELDRREEEYRLNPQNVVSWEEVKQRIQAPKKP